MKVSPVVMFIFFTYHPLFQNESSFQSNGSSFGREVDRSSVVNFVNENGRQGSNEVISDYQTKVAQLSTELSAVVKERNELDQKLLEVIVISTLFIGSSSSFYIGIK
jgi:hypothetical protein